jgi:hypothetical protein
MTYDYFAENFPENQENPEFLIHCIRFLDSNLKRCLVREKAMNTALQYFATMLDREGATMDEHTTRFMSVLTKCLDMDRPLEHSEMDCEILNHAYRDLISQ